MAFNADSPFLYLSFVDSTCVLYVYKHSVEVDPEVSETVRAFYGFSIEGDCWHCLSYCFVVEGAPQGLRLAWADFGLCLLAPMSHLFQLLLDSSYCCAEATGCFVDKPVVRKRNHCCSDPSVPLCRHCRGPGTEGSLMEVPLSVVGA